MQWIKAQRDGRAPFRCFLAIFLAFISACSDPRPQRVNRSLTQSNQAAHHWQWWNEEARHVQYEFFSAVRQGCRPAEMQLPDPLGHDSCVRNTILASLGAQSSGVHECRAEESTPLFLLCVGLGTTAELILESLGPDTDASMDWHDPMQSFANATTLLGQRLDTKCRYSRQSDCIAREMTYLFALESSEADRCAAAGSMELQVRCTAVLSLIEKYRSALLYVG